MDYIDLFLSDHPKKLSNLEKLNFTLATIKQFNNEVYGKKYQQKLTKEYYPEDKIVSFLDLFSQTPFYKGFVWMYGAQIEGLENIPKDDGALLVSNHSTIYLADIAPLYFNVHKQLRRITYGLGHKIFRYSDLIKTLGGTYGRRDIATKLLSEGNLALSCPGGILDACKPVKKSYQVQKVEGFSDTGLGYLRVAHAAKKPIIPVINIGAEENVLILGNAKPVVEKLFNGLDSLIDFYDSSTGKKLSRLIEDVKLVPIVVSPPIRRNVKTYIGNQIDPITEIGLNPTDEEFQKLNDYVIETLQNMIDSKLRQTKPLFSYFRRHSLNLL